MKGYFAVAIMAIAAVSAGCTSTRQNVVRSTAPSMIAAQDTKLAGFPRIEIKRDDLGNCTRVSEDFVTGPETQGKKTWRRVSHLESLGQHCPQG